MCCPLCGETLTILVYPNTLSTPQVAADYSIEQGHPGSERLSAQPQDPVLQHVKRTTDSVLGQRLSICLECSPSRQLAMPGGMPASASQADKGAAACAAAASLPGPRLLTLWSSQRQSWLDVIPLFQAGSTDHHPTSRRPRAQGFENESSFNVLGVSGPMKTKAKFDLFSREVTVACRTIAS